MATREERGFKALADLTYRARQFAVRVAPVYKQLDWHWRNGPETPTIQEIETEALRLIALAAAHRSRSMTSGGILVKIEEGNAHLSMVISTSSFEKIK